MISTVSFAILKATNLLEILDLTYHLFVNVLNYTLFSDPNRSGCQARCLFSLFTTEPIKAVILLYSLKTRAILV